MDPSVCAISTPQLPPKHSESADSSHEPGTLIEAIATQNLQALSLLLQAKAAVNAALDPDRTTPIIHAVKIQCPTNILSVLIEAGANLQTYDSYGYSALYYAKRSRNMPVYEQLRNAGAKALSAVDFHPNWERHGHSSLSDATLRAIVTQNLHALSLLLQAKADVNAPLDRYRTTPIIHAVKIRCPTNILSVLIEAGANLQTYDRHGYSALYYAKRSRNVLAYEQLRAAGAKALSAVDFHPNYERHGHSSLYDPTTPVQSVSVTFNDTCAVKGIDRRFSDNLGDDDIAELMATANYLLTIAQQPEEEEEKSNRALQLRYNPFIQDIAEMYQRILKLIRKRPEVIAAMSPERAVVDCLIDIIREQYASIEERFTAEQIRDVIQQRKQLRKEELKELHYDYVEYDQDSLTEAIATYRHLARPQGGSYRVVCIPGFKKDSPRKDYVYIEVAFTAEKIRDVKKQLKQLRKKEITEKQFEYAEYDPVSLDEAIAAYRRNATTEAGSYRVARYCVPGFKKTNITYHRLIQAVLGMTSTKATALTPRALRNPQSPSENKNQGNRENPEG